MADENAQWFDSLGLDDENKGLAQSKGWADSNAVFNSYRELEKAMGADKNDFIKIPKSKDGETPDYSEVYRRLGRPETADEYDLPDTDFARDAKEALFKAGLTKSQAKELEAWIDEYTKTTQEKSEAENAALMDEKIKSQIESLKKEWGADFEKNQALARSVTKDLGLSDEQIDKIGDIMGADTLSKLFLQAATRSDGEVSIRNYQQSGGETREIAALKIAEMKRDPETLSKLANGDTKIAEEFKRLAAITVSGN